MARNGVSLGGTLWRGLQRKCPCCGKGKAFRGYLTIVDTCAVCDTPLSLYPTDDGPAYITILLVGHLVVAPVLTAYLLGFTAGMPPAELTIATVGAMAVLTLAILPFVKGAFLALLWYLGLKHVR